MYQNLILIRILSNFKFRAFLYYILLLYAFRNLKISLTCIYIGLFCLFTNLHSTNVLGYYKFWRNWYGNFFLIFANFLIQLFIRVIFFRGFFYLSMSLEMLLFLLTLIVSLTQNAIDWLRLCKIIRERLAWPFLFEFYILFSLRLFFLNSIFRIVLWRRRMSFFCRGL